MGNPTQASWQANPGNTAEIQNPSSQPPFGSESPISSFFARISSITSLFYSVWRRGVEWTSPWITSLTEQVTYYSDGLREQLKTRFHAISSTMQSSMLSNLKERVSHYFFHMLPLLIGIGAGLLVRVCFFAPRIPSLWPFGISLMIGASVGFIYRVFQDPENIRVLQEKGVFALAERVIHNYWGSKTVYVSGISVFGDSLLPIADYLKIWKTWNACKEAYDPNSINGNYYLSLEEIEGLQSKLNPYLDHPTEKARSFIYYTLGKLLCHYVAYKKLSSIENLLKDTRLKKVLTPMERASLIFQFGIRISVCRGMKDEDFLQKLINAYKEARSEVKETDSEERDQVHLLFTKMLLRDALCSSYPRRYCLLLSEGSDFNLAEKVKLDPRTWDSPIPAQIPPPAFHDPETAFVFPHLRLSLLQALAIGKQPDFEIRLKLPNIDLKHRDKAGNHLLVFAALSNDFELYTLAMQYQVAIMGESLQAWLPVLYAALQVQNYKIFEHALFNLLQKVDKTNQDLTPLFASLREHIIYIISVNEDSGQRFLELLNAQARALKVQLDEQSLRFTSLKAAAASGNENLFSKDFNTWWQQSQAKDKLNELLSYALLAPNISWPIVENLIKKGARIPREQALQLLRHALTHLRKEEIKNKTHYLLEAVEEGDEGSFIFDQKEDSKHLSSILLWLIQNADLNEFQYFYETVLKEHFFRTDTQEYLINAILLGKEEIALYLLDKKRGVDPFVAFISPNHPVNRLTPIEVAIQSKNSTVVEACLNFERSSSSSLIEDHMKIRIALALVGMGNNGKLLERFKEKFGVKEMPSTDPLDIPSSTAETALAEDAVRAARHGVEAEADDEYDVVSPASSSASRRPSSGSSSGNSKPSTGGFSDVALRSSAPANPTAGSTAAPPVSPQRMSWWPFSG